MDNIKKIIIEKKPKSIADYFTDHKRIENEKMNRKIFSDRTIKIAILSSFTTKGIQEVLNVKCCSLGVLPEFYEAPYNQYAQEILNNQSRLYKFEPDVAVLFIDSMTLLGDSFFFPYRLSDEGRKKMLVEKCNEIIDLVKTLSQNISGKIILHNFEVPTYSPMGMLENKENFGFIEMMRKLNSRLEGNFKNNSQVFIFDYDSFCSKHGKKQLIDKKMYYLADMKIDLNLIPDLCEDYMGLVKPISSLIKKCIVLDLDNTLWGGIVGEDGLEGIKLGPTPEGRPFLEFQKYILSLFERGVILAVNSRNNPDDALKVLREHPYMILKEKHFASMKINWNDKITNMKDIAKEINIGLDSMVFLDDDKANREMVKKAIPEVHVVDMPDDPSLFVQTIMNLNEFNVLQITEEDKKKGEMYAAQRKRQELQSSSADISEFLRELNIKVAVARASSFTIPRISQLTQKTNQFNMTTRRYLEEDIEKFSKSDRHLVLSIKVEDKFGDNGIAGAVIIEKCANNWRIDTFLLSCRVLGREIEKAILAFVVEKMKKEGCQKLIGEFIQTKKNESARDFYQSNNFKLVSSSSGIQIWEFDLNYYECIAPDFIKIME